MALSRHPAGWDRRGTTVSGNHGARCNGIDLDYWLLNEATNRVQANEGVC